MLEVKTININFSKMKVKCNDNYKIEMQDNELENLASFIYIMSLGIKTGY